jgi:hypothetical protein
MVGTPQRGVPTVLTWLRYSRIFSEYD